MAWVRLLWRITKRFYSDWEAIWLVTKILTRNMANFVENRIAHCAFLLYNTVSEIKKLSSDNWVLTLLDHRASMQNLNSFRWDRKGFSTSGLSTGSRSQFDLSRNKSIWYNMFTFSPTNLRTDPISRHGSNIITIALLVLFSIHLFSLLNYSYIIMVFNGSYFIWFRWLLHTNGCFVNCFDFSSCSQN